MTPQSQVPCGVGKLWFFSDMGSKVHNSPSKPRPSLEHNYLRLHLHLPTSLWPVTISPHRPFSAARERRRSNDDSDNALSALLHAWAGWGPRKMKPHSLQACSSTVPNVQVHMAAFGNWRSEHPEQWTKCLCSQINFGQIKVRCLKHENIAFIFLVC